MPMPTAAPSPVPSQGSIWRWLPLAGLAALMGLSFAMGWHKYLSFRTIGLNYGALRTYIDGHLLLSLALYVLAYVAVVALSLPGALVMTLSGGLLFGWQLGAPAAVVGATIGATLIFLIARSSIGEAIAARAGPAVARLRDGFRDNALSYLLFLRLVPVFPFVIVNLAAAALGVSLRAYLVGTFFGIMPATVAYSYAGSALGRTIERQNALHQACLAGAPASPDVACPYSIDTGALVSREVIIAFALLGVVALIPAIVKSWRSRHAAV